MRCCGKALTSVAVLLLAAVLPASAGSISSSYTDTFSVTGTKTPTTVTATFSFDTSKDTIGGQLTFAGGVFNTIRISRGTDIEAGCGQLRSRSLLERRLLQE